MQTKYFLKNQAIPKAKRQLGKLERMLMNAIADAGKEIKHNPLQRVIRKKLKQQVEHLKQLELKYNELNNLC
jgi:hypothetical protein